MRFQPLFSLTSLLASAHAHGVITNPPPRAIGAASLSACGETITSLIETDNQSSIDALREAAITAKDFHKSECNLSLCKGLQLKDNLHHIQNWVTGQDVTIETRERIPHTGWASVAIVDTKTMFIIGEELITFETKSLSGYDTVDRGFVVTIPELYPRCLIPGECVLQWTWFGRVVKQTYESCIDFTIALESDESSDNEGMIQKILIKETEY